VRATLGNSVLLARAAIVIALVFVGVLVLALPPASSSTRPQGSPSFTERFTSPELNQGNWTQLTGTWRPSVGSVTLESSTQNVSPPQDVRQNDPTAVNGLLIHQSASAPKRTSVTLVKGTDGCGLALRYEDQSNFWYLVRSADFATWTLHSVEDGVERYRGNSGPSPTEDSTRISVVDYSSSIRIVAEGFNFNRSETVVDTVGTTREGSAGLIATSNCTTGVWANFEETR
jgi:hypothetical protein